MSLSHEGRTFSSVHLVGVYGSGMSAIAQMLRWDGCGVSGSDRMMDDPDCQRVQRLLAAMGCRIVPQDGSGIGPRTEAIVVSTAIEKDNPDMRAAAGRNLPILHRSDVLAALVARNRTVAVAGTSGKSTVTALAFELLHRCGRSPSLVSGANVTFLVDKGYVGNAFKGDGGPLVIEADESDGTLVKYHPAISVFLNVSKDHKPVAETMELFAALGRQSGRVIVNADDATVAGLPHHATFGMSATADTHPSAVASLSPAIRCTIGDQTVDFPQRGRHNLYNLLAAMAVCRELGCGDEELAAAAAQYRGLKRRFEITGTAAGVTVIDDFAHNPEKIKAALEAAQAMGGRVFAVWQPHGFAPTRFMKEELIDALSSTARPGDEVRILPIYYAGGTVQQDISSDDLVCAIRNRGVSAWRPPDRATCIAAIVARVKSGDTVLVMGARDPSLPAFANDLVTAIAAGRA